MSAIPVVIVEDDPNVLNRIQKLIANAEGFEHAASYISAEELLADAEFPRLSGRWDLGLIIIDLGLPGMSGNELTVIVKEKFPNLRVIVYTVFEDEPNILRAIESGANGYLLKDTDDELLLADMKVVALGGSTLTPRVARKIIRASEKSPGSSSKEKNILTGRQTEILNLIALGMKYAEIAEELDISVHTVCRHIEGIYERLNVNSKTQAILKGRNMGLLD